MGRYIKHKMRTKNILQKANVPGWERTKSGEANGTDSTPTMTITPPRIEVLSVRIVGLSPFVQLKFSAKAKGIMRGKMAEGGASRSKKTRTARNFEEDYIGAIHRSTEGWAGIPAPAFRNALISACRLVSFKMTMAKMSLFVLADGADVDDGTPLVKIEGEPEPVEHMVRNATGVADIRVRAMWREWACNLRLQYDKDQFTRQDVVNLLMRAGLQVGVGEGRPDSKASAGMGWGQFQIESNE